MPSAISWAPVELPLGGMISLTNAPVLGSLGAVLAGAP
jgi:hypothetical protein